jgi:hypothetical protein
LPAHVSSFSGMSSRYLYFQTSFLDFCLLSFLIHDNMTIQCYSSLSSKNATLKISLFSFLNFSVISASFLSHFSGTWSLLLSIC